MNLFDTSDPRPLHMMGVAGAGMRALALVARSRGVPVTGCDLQSGDMPDLVAAGVRVAPGHDARHVEGIRALVITSAVPGDHPEIRAAHADGVPVLKRAEALALVVQGQTLVAVAGTHGKTTTTVMTTEALAAAECDPTGIAGGLVSSWGGNARIGGDPVVVVEADEYDRSFLTLEPTVAVVTNVEPDHLECYDGSVDVLESAFATFAGRARQAVVCVDDVGGRRLAERLGDEAWRVSLDPRTSADVSLRKMAVGPSGSHAVLDVRGTAVDFVLPVPGRHNVANASCALAAVAACGLDPRRGANALSVFAGVGRRFERLGSAGGIDFIDDYAHHPTEVRATLEAAREVFGDRRIIAIFQPHLFSRTQEFSAELADALRLADRVLVIPIYPAREAPIPGVTGELVSQAIEAGGGDATYFGNALDVSPHVRRVGQAGDVIITIGAGDITQIGRKLAADMAAEDSR